MSIPQPNAEMPKPKQPYEIPATIGKLRSSKIPKYALWVKSQSPKDMQDPPNVDVKNDDGMYYDASAKVLQPEQVKDVCIRANVMQVDAEYTTDLTHVNMLHAGCELTNVFTWTDDFINSPELVEGKTTWIMPNVSNKREESNITPNVIQWMNFIKRAMQNAKEHTTIIFGQPIPYTTVDPQMNVTLDRRLLQLATRKWLATVIYQGVPQLYAYDTLQTSKTYRKMIPMTSSKDEPYAFYIFNSKKSYSEY